MKLTWRNWKILLIQLNPAWAHPDGRHNLCWRSEKWALVISLLENSILKATPLEGRCLCGPLKTLNRVLSVLINPTDSYPIWEPSESRVDLAHVSGEIRVMRDVLAEGHEKRIDGSVETDSFGTDDADGNVARGRKREARVAQRSVPAHRSVNLRKRQARKVGQILIVMTCDSSDNKSVSN